MTLDLIPPAGAERAKPGRKKGVFQPPHKKRVRSCHPLLNILRKIRIARRISQVTLGDLAGYSGSTVRKWESGQHLPSLLVILDWAQALGLRLAFVDENGVEVKDFELPPYETTAERLKRISEAYQKKRKEKEAYEKAHAAEILELRREKKKITNKKHREKLKAKKYY